MQADACCTSTIEDFSTPPHPWHNRSLNGAWLQHPDHPNNGKASNKGPQAGGMKTILPRSQNKRVERMNYPTTTQHLGNLLKTIH